MVNFADRFEENTARGFLHHPRRQHIVLPVFLMPTISFTSLFIVIVTSNHQSGLEGRLLGGECRALHWAGRVKNTKGPAVEAALLAAETLADVSAIK